MTSDTLDINKSYYMSWFSLPLLIQSIDVLEAEMLNGQKLQGPHTAHELSTILKKEGKEAE